MQSEEQQVIDGLFNRLKDAEAQSASRDAQAEALINEHIGRQPAAPYYMAQVILIQEAGLKRLDQRVRDLEAQLEQAQRQRPAQGGGGFLAGLFGAGPSRPAPNAQERGWNEPGPRASAVPPASPAPGSFGQAYAQAQAPSRGTGFLGGALQTAAGVAGGMVLGNMLTGLFQHSQPQEIVEIIKEQPAAADSAQTQDYAASDSTDYSGGNDYASDDGYQDAGLDDSGGFFDDDDSFV